MLEINQTLGGWEKKFRFIHRMRRTKQGITWVSKQPHCSFFGLREYGAPAQNRIGLCLVGLKQFREPTASSIRVFQQPLSKREQVEMPVIHLVPSLDQSRQSPFFSTSSRLSTSSEKVHHFAGRA